MQLQMDPGYHRWGPVRTTVGRRENPFTGKKIFTNPLTLFGRNREIYTYESNRLRVAGSDLPGDIMNRHTSHTSLVGGILLIFLLTANAVFAGKALALPSHREQSNVGLCASFMAELGGLSYMKE